MCTFAVEDAIDLDFYSRAITPPPELWSEEVSKFRCPEHGRPAHLHFSAPASLANPPLIEACCAEFAHFCRYAFRYIVSSEIGPEREHSAAFGAH